MITAKIDLVAEDTKEAISYLKTVISGLEMANDCNLPLNYVHTGKGNSKLEYEGFDDKFTEEEQITKKI